MKKFSFPLDRVLNWRNTQTRLEEAALARLNIELQALDLRCAALDRSVVDAQGKLLGAAAATPQEIGALEHFRNSISAQVRYLLQSRRTLEQKIALQTQTVLDRRRDAQLLGQLRERQWKSWQASTNRELDQQAEESFLARLVRHTS